MSRPIAPTRPLVRVAPGTAIRTLVERHAGAGISPRALEIETLLHLPRLADRRGLVETDRADAEVARLRTRLRLLHDPVLPLLRPPAALPELAELRFDAVEESLAATVAAHLHYLHSARRRSFHFGSYFGRRLVVCVSLSSLDLATVRAALPVRIHADETLVVSRVFAFDWAPRNTISYLLAQLESRLRETRPETRLLLTYLNPNLGFDGASYRAANWSVFGQETGTRYGYLDDDYVTDREISCLSDAMRRRVVYSVMPLAPLTIYGRLLQRQDRRRPILPRVLPRPEPSDGRD